MSLNNKTASQLSAMLKNKECSSKEIANSFLTEIKNTNPELNSFITITEDLALKQAKKADEIIAKGEQQPLTGIPVVIKDNISTEGVLTTCASKMLANYAPPFNATVVEKMNKAGMVTLGKANMDEFAIGTSGKSSYYGATISPINKDYTVGGSSSGSAVSVAAMQTPLALGSDTGGSIRVPSSYCGVVGFKPTYGTVSRYGGVALASSFDQIGPIGRTVEDVAMLYDVIKGQDKKDATTLSVDSKPSLTSFEKPLSGLKIGIVKEFFQGSDEVMSSVMKGAKLLEEQGAVLVDLKMNSLEHALSAYYIISSAEISSNLGKYDGARFGFRAENYEENYNDMFIKTRTQGFGLGVQERIMIGTYVLSSKQYHTFFTRAKTVQNRIIDDFNQVFNNCDLLLTPTTFETAFKVTEEPQTVNIYTSDIVTAPANLAGLPALSMPCGVDKKGLPIGMQLIGEKFSDSMVLGVAHQFEQLIGGFAGGAK